MKFHIFFRCFCCPPSGSFVCCCCAWYMCVLLPPENIQSWDVLWKQHWIFTYMDTSWTSKSSAMVSLQSLKLEVPLEQICCSSSARPSFIIMNSPFATEQSIHIVSGGFRSQRPRRMLPIDPHESQSSVLNRGKHEVALLEQICCSSSARQSFIIMHSPFATEQSIHIVSGGFMSQRPRRMLHIDLYLGTNKFWNTQEEMCKNEMCSLSSSDIGKHILFWLHYSKRSQNTPEPQNPLCYPPFYPY